MNAPANFVITLRRVALGCLASGALFSLASVGAALLSPESFYPAWLVSFWFWLGLSLGSLALSMLHHLTGGGWGRAIRRILESASACFVVLAAAFLPIVLGMRTLYPWTDEAHVAEDVVLSRKTDYLNVEFFLIRAAIYFFVWLATAFVLNRATAGDVGSQHRREAGLAKFSAFSLALWALAVTFAAIDWAMSIEPHWFSSMYPVLYMGGQAVSAFSLAIIVSILLRSPRFRGGKNQTGPANVLTTARQHDLGNFLLAFVMFWSYVSFMQYLIIWSGNLPEESPWYILRGQGGWQVIVAMLMGLHFFFPFMLLLMRRSKRAAPRLAAIAGLLLFMRLVDLTWLIMPPFVPSLVGGKSSLLNLWPLLVTLPAIGGFWLAMFCWRLSARALLPVYEPERSPERLPGEAHDHSHAGASHATH